MSLICFAGAKGSPGVTLTALATAAAWPAHDGDRKLLLEADPAGGTIAVRYQLGRQPGLITLAAAGRHGTLTRDELWSHAQILPGGLPAVVSPERADRARAILDASGRSLGGWLAALPDVTVIADCGRLGPAPSSGSICASADVVLVVVRPSAEYLHGAAAGAAELRAAGRRVAWVPIGDTPHSPAEIERVTGLPVARVLPDDPRTAADLAAGRIRRRTPLVRELAALAIELAGLVSSSKAPAIAAPAAEPELPAPLRSLAGAVR
jgi:hypothetical protein